VDAYREIELDSFRTEQNEKTKKEIEDTLDTINQAFEKLLNSFFEERAMDISSDISSAVSDDLPGLYRFFPHLSLLCHTLSSYW